MQRPPTAPTTTPFAALLTGIQACTRCAGHLPLGPRPLVRTHPQARLLIAGQAPGRKVHATGLPDQGASITEVVQSWRSTWPHTVALPHPNPRNHLWLQHNRWFDEELLPVLRARVQEVLAHADSDRGPLA